MECYKKDYPRPQLVRDNWTSLNGTWDFCFDDEASWRTGRLVSDVAGESGTDNRGTVYV